MQYHFPVVSKNLPKSILELPIDTIGLTVRLTEQLEGLGFRTIADLVVAPLGSIFPEGNPSRSAMIHVVSVLNERAEVGNKHCDTLTK